MIIAIHSHLLHFLYLLYWLSKCVQKQATLDSTTPITNKTFVSFNFVFFGIHSEKNFCISSQLSAMLNVRYNLSTHRLHLIDGTERPLKYMLNDFWTDYSEPYSRGFPLVSDGPWNLLTLLGTWLLLILILQARAKAGLAKLELRPLMLIFNSFQFAINFLGFLVVAFYITDFGVSLWSCTFSISGNFHLTVSKFVF